MSGRANQLETLQRWMLTAITDSAKIEPADVAQLILPSSRQTAAERLAIYGQAYFARLLEVLRQLFPCTRFAVGDELFDQFSVGYLRAYPPQGYTLDRLADNLVDYLEATRPPDWGAMVVELARLEQAIDRIFDAPGPEGLPPLVVPANANHSLRLQFIPGLELHAFGYPVSRYYTNWKAGRLPDWPMPAEQFVALLRRDFVVRRYELSIDQYKLLRALERHSTLGEALTVVASDRSSKVDQLAADFQRWFAVWAAEGFFAIAR